MRSMDDRKAVWMDLDDDYLIGISNKGIVKRAYKDKEEGNYEVLSADGEAKVRVGGETVRIRFPLGESQCSCPSRTICRHVILGILAWKEKECETERRTGGETAEHPTESPAVNPEAEKPEKPAEHPEAEKPKKPAEYPEAEKPEKLAEHPEAEKPAEDLEAILPEKAPEKGEAEKPEEAAGNGMAEWPEAGGMRQELSEEIAAYPLVNIRRILGSRRLQDIAGQIKAGQKPRITYSSIVTVCFPEQGNTVKLLSPLEYSSCTCHKKEFCVHKAAAVLWCKREAGLVTLAEVEAETAERPEFETGQIKEAAGRMKNFLEELLNTGLARTSPDVLDYLERLAIISHNLRLAGLERQWRALNDSYGSYLKRKASFRIQELMERLAGLYRRTELLCEAEDGRQIAELAGEFKAEYMPAGDMDLIGIAMEPFESRTGYEGETVYFLEEHTKEWYTYTYARPVFYEKRGRRGQQGKIQAPWGLPLSLEELAEARIHLTGAKCDGRGRLSSSQETKGELTGDRKRGENRLREEELSGWYYRDFGTLFKEQIGKKRKPWLREESEEEEGTELVFIKPQSFDQAVFSETEQKLSMSLYDGAGKEVVVEVAYSKKESWGIRYLERMTEEKLPCFLGKIYLRDRRIRMYPVTVFEKGELSGDGSRE